MFKGSFTALVTPFLPDGGVDEKSFRALVEWQIAEGADGLVPVGTTGESPTLTHEEHRRVVEICIGTAAGRVPVIAGAGSNNTAEAVELCRHAEGAGADAVLVVTPYYNKPNRRGLYGHFAAVARATGLPVFIYNIPSRSVIDMTPETMGRLAGDFPNIRGVKDATGRVERVSEQRAACGTEFIQLSGEDASVWSARIQRPWRRRRDFGHGQCGAEAVRGVSGRDPERRPDPRARIAGPADAAAPGGLSRSRRVGGQIRSVPSGPAKISSDRRWRRSTDRRRTPSTPPCAMSG